VSGDGEIYRRMLALLKDIEPIAKAQRNEAQRFDFRGIDQIYDALHPLLVKHEILCVPRVVDMHTEEYQTTKGTVMHRTMVTVAHRFCTGDGSFVEAVTLGEAADAQDKSAAKAQSVAYKYAMFETFCIPLGDDADSGSPDGPASARSGGKRIGGPRIDQRQKSEIWAEATRTAEGLGVDRAEIMRAILEHFECTRTEGLARAQFDAVMAKVKDPGDLIQPTGESQGEDDG